MHLGGLASEDNPRAARTGVHLVQHHVLQLLVVHGAHENVGLQRLPAAAAGQQVLAAVAEPMLHLPTANALSPATHLSATENLKTVVQRTAMAT